LATDPDTTQQPTPPWLRWLSRISLMVGVVAIGLTAWSVGLANVAHHLRSIGWWFALTLGLDVVATAFDAGAIFALARHGPGLSFGRVLVAQMGGRAVNAVTPGGALGEAVKASVLAESVSANRAVAAVVYCGLVSVIVSLSMVALGAPLTGVFLTALPDALRVVLVVGGVLAAGATIGLTVLVSRGMLSSIADLGVKVRLISGKRRERWKRRLEDIDQRLHGTRGSGARRIAAGCVMVSKAIGWVSLYVILRAVGYDVTIGMLAAILSASVILSWMSAIVPMGLGVAETGNYALFSALDAPATVGVALALARRVNQIVFAAVGFTVLGLWRLWHEAAPKLKQRLARRRSG